jgi:hypothetical protein
MVAFSWPVTLFGKTFTEADFKGTKYVGALPDALAHFVQHAAALWTATSASSIPVGTGHRDLVTQTGKPWLPGSPLRLSLQTDPTHVWMDAVVSSYDQNTGALGVEVVGASGSGTWAAWNINAGGGGYALNGALGLDQGGTGATSLAQAQSNFGMKGGAFLDVAAEGGPSNPGRLVALDINGKYPAFDGSRITNITAGAIAGLDLSNVLLKNAAGTLTAAGPATGMTAATNLQLTIASGNTTAAGITFTRTQLGVAVSANFGIDTDNWLAARGPGNVYKDVKANNLKAYASFLFADSGASLSYDPAGQHGSYDVTGSRGGYAGFNFVSVARRFMVHPSNQGIYVPANSTWQWLWQDGVLSVGSVPIARIPDIAAARVAFASSAGSAPANGGSATYATYSAGGQNLDTVAATANSALALAQQAAAAVGVGGGSQPTSCFIAEAVVTMADGSKKPIPDVRVGELVDDGRGGANEVLALDRTTLGGRPLFWINGDHWTTDEHPHVSADGGFYAIRPEALDDDWGMSHPVILADGSTALRENVGLTRPVERLEHWVELDHAEGPTAIISIRSFTRPPETPLFNLVLGGSHTYRVDGYLVTGWPREDDFDYDAWKPRRLEPAA